MWHVGARYAARSHYVTHRLTPVSAEMELRDVCLPVGSGSVLRCDWSPDGCAVTVPHSQLRTKETDDSPAGQRALTTSATLQRDMWQVIAHHTHTHAATTAVRYSPKLFRAGAGPVADGKAWSGQYACVMCVGSVDGCVSIWSNTHSHARAAITHAFAAAVTDITWYGPQPQELLLHAPQPTSASHCVAMTPQGPHAPERSVRLRRWRSAGVRSHPQRARGATHSSRDGRSTGANVTGGVRSPRCVQIHSPSG